MLPLLFSYRISYILYRFVFLSGAVGPLCAADGSPAAFAGFAHFAMRRAALMCERELQHCNRSFMVSQ